MFAKNIFTIIYKKSSRIWQVFNYCSLSRVKWWARW